MDTDFQDACQDLGNEIESPEHIDSVDEFEFEMDQEYDEVQHGGSKIEVDDDYNFEVLSIEDIVNYMSESINEVTTVTKIPPTTVRILLHHFKWDTEKLMERFYSEDQEKLFQEAQVFSPFRSAKVVMADRLESSRPGHSSNSFIECEICCSSVPWEMITGLQCGHMFCIQCWTEYLTTKIMDEGASQLIECPGACNIVVDDHTVMTLITDPRVKLKYQHLITNSFVQCNRLLRWCPSPNCNNAIKVQHVEARPVKCKCSHEFCFNCCEKVHDPVKCHLIKKWMKKCVDDSETNNWMIAKTKECPKCSAIIEKDGGCNHVVCTNQNCKTEFCWDCLGDWQSHTGLHGGCKRSTSQLVADLVKSRERNTARDALKRYLNYNERYMSYNQSLQLEHKYYSFVEDKMEEMQQHNMSWIEVQFLKKSLEILCECRRTIMYSFVFAYYLKKNNHSTIFEDIQKDLQIATDELCGYFERDFSPENFVKMKIKVQDQYRYCDSRRKILVAYVHEGYKKDWWGFH